MFMDIYKNKVYSSSQKMPNVSLVMPMYNVGAFLEKCLVSIYAQDFDSWELIIVNDGSSDNSRLIAEEMADDSIIPTLIIDKINGGLSDARNVGLKFARGRYSVFCDSDDVVSPTFLADLYRNIVNYGGIAVSQIKRIEEQNPALLSRTAYSDPVFLSNKETIIALIKTRQIDVCAVGKMAETILWQRVTFPLGVVHEDMATTYRLFMQASGATITSYPLYGYYIHSNSLTRESKLSDKRCLDFVSIIRERADYLLKYFPEFDCEIRASLAEDYIYILNLINSQSDNSFVQENLRQELELYIKRPVVLRSLCKGSTKQRFKYFLYRVSPKLYSYLRERHL